MWRIGNVWMWEQGAPDPAAYRCCQATPGACVCIGTTSTSKEVQNRKCLAEIEIDLAQLPRLWDSKMTTSLVRLEW